MTGGLRLRPLTADDEPEALAAHAELAADGFDFLLHWRPGTDWAAYLAQLERQAAGTDLAPGLVPADFLVAELDGVIVGRTSVRHALNAFLEERGGHVGYGVRPAHRRRGHAGTILRLSLRRLAGLGVREALVTCDADNVASRRTIEGAGGRPDPRRPASDDSAVLRFWVPTPG